MRKSKLLAIVMGIVFVLATVALLGNSSTLWAAEDSGKQCRIVMIQSRVGVSPETLHVKKGNCVVWINYTRGEDIKITFKEGEKCQIATKAPVGFSMDSRSCYGTDYLDFGRTASLLFDQVGTFRYEIEVRAPATSPSAERIGFARSGTIIVK